MKVVCIGQFLNACILDDSLRECCRWVRFILHLKTPEENETVFNDENWENVQKVKLQLVGCAELSFLWKNVVEFADALLYILIKKYEIVFILRREQPHPFPTYVRNDHIWLLRHLPNKHISINQN